VNGVFPSNNQDKRYFLNHNVSYCHSERRIIAAFLILLCCFCTHGYSFAQEQDSTRSVSNLTKESAPRRESFRLGLWGAYNVSQHSVNFTEFRTTPLFSPRSAAFPGPPNLRAAGGAGISIGALSEIPLAENFSLSLRLSFVQHTSLLTTQEAVLLGDLNGDVQENTIEYRINAALASVGLEIFAKYKIVSGFHALLGLRGGYMLGHAYSQSERLLLPSRGGFSPAFEQTRNPQSGDVPDLVPVQMWAVGGLGYDIPLRLPVGNVHITPEIAYSFALTNALQSGGSGSENALWQLHYLRGGVNITLPIGEMLAAPPDTALLNAQRRDSLARVIALNDSLNTALAYERNADSVRRAGLILAAPTQKNVKKESIYAKQALLKAQTLVNTRTIDIKPVSIVRSVKRVNGRDVSDEQENENLIIPIQELLVRDELPLLPYIFFDGENSFKIPERYAKLDRSEIEQFNPEKLKVASSLVPKEHSYYHLLNIIGFRMKRLPQTTLNLLGCTDGFTSERERSRLAPARANAVAEYLRTVWGIDSTRLVLSELRGGLSAKPSRPLHETEKQAENRRVELSSDTTALFAPLLLTDTIAHTLTPIMRFYLIIPPTLSIKSWKIKIRQGRQTLKEFRGNGKPPLAIDWRVDAKEMEKMTERTSDKIATAEGIECTFDVLEQSGAGISSPTRGLEMQERRFRVNADERVENSLVERQTLILFDGGKSTLTQSHLEILKGVNARMTSNSKVVFEGFMDKTGDEEFNERLSLARAQAAAQALRFNVRGAQVEIKGYGSSKVLYENRLPEGRIYSRAVRITQETPLNE
jgi:outer membrane protein OmpA-like peptidoglycan-associated protein